MPQPQDLTGQKKGSMQRYDPRSGWEIFNGTSGQVIVFDSNGVPTPTTINNTLVYLPMTNWAATFGTPVLAQVGSAASVLDKTYAWAFDGAAAEVIQYQGLFGLPGDRLSTSTLGITLIWAPSTGGAGNVAWEIDYALLNGAADQIDKVTAKLQVTTATPAVAEQLGFSSVTTAALTASQEYIRVSIERRGDLAGDTYDGLDVWLAAVQLSYTRNI